MVTPNVHHDDWDRHHSWEFWHLHRQIGQLENPTFLPVTKNRTTGSSDNVTESWINEDGADCGDDGGRHLDHSSSSSSDQIGIGFKPRWDNMLTRMLTMKLANTLLPTMAMLLPIVLSCAGAGEEDLIESGTEWRAMIFFGILMFQQTTEWMNANCNRVFKQFLQTHRNLESCNQLSDRHQQKMRGPWPTTQRRMAKNHDQPCKTHQQRWQPCHHQYGGRKPPAGRQQWKRDQNRWTRKERPQQTKPIWSQQHWSVFALQWRRKS